MDLELVIGLVVLIGLLSKGKILHNDFFSISSQIDSRSNRPQSAPVKSVPSKNGLKMKVKSATYFKMNKKKCIYID